MYIWNGFVFLMNTGQNRIDSKKNMLITTLSMMKTENQTMLLKDLYL